MEKRLNDSQQNPADESMKTSENMEESNTDWLQYIYETTFNEEDREMWSKMLAKKKKEE